MTFPQKTKWLKRPIGWEDLGRQEVLTKRENGENIDTWEVHTLCKTTLHIGKENGEVFLFCPRCLKK